MWPLPPMNFYGQPKTCSIIKGQPHVTLRPKSGLDRVIIVFLISLACSARPKLWMQNYDFFLKVIFTTTDLSQKQLKTLVFSSGMLNINLQTGD